MKTAFSTAVAVLVCGTGIGFTQTPSTTTPSQAGAADAPIVVTGCVSRDTSAGAAAFKLKDVEAAKTTAITPGRSTMPGAQTPSTTPRTEPGSTPGATPGSTQPGSAQRPTPGSSSSQMGHSMPDLEDEYRLEAAASVNLAQHVNHQVEVTGTVAKVAGARSTMPGRSTPSGSSTPGSTSTPGASSAPGASGSSSGSAGMNQQKSTTTSDVPTLRVTSLRMISSTCQ